VAGASINTQLLAYSDLTDLVSTRIHRVKLPQNGAYPSVRFHQSGEEPQNLVTGEDSKKHQFWQFDIYGENPESVKPVADEVENAMGAATTYCSKRINRFDGLYEEDEQVYKTTIDFSVWK